MSVLVLSLINQSLNMNSFEREGEMDIFIKIKKSWFASNNDFYSHLLKSDFHDNKNFITIQNEH